MLGRIEEGSQESVDLGKAPQPARQAVDVGATPGLKVRAQREVESSGPEIKPFQARHQHEQHGKKRQLPAPGEHPAGELEQHENKKEVDGERERQDRLGR